MTLPILTIECLLGHFASIFLEAEFPLEANFFLQFFIAFGYRETLHCKKNSGNFFAILTNAIIVIIGVVVVVIVVVDIVVVVVINVVVVVDSILRL